MLNFFDLLKTNIKSINTLTFFFLVIISISCSKEKTLSGADTVWYGTYPTTMVNSSDGEQKERTACIELTFSHNALECTVSTGILGLFATNRVIHSAEWYDENSFSIFDKQADQTIKYYYGTISNGKMHIEILSCDNIVATVELNRIK